ncbi:MAG: ABC transporter permease [Rhodobacteraceae bacterium]|jgi:peptide/nickel transport system permease protein|nr:ABC transporter permease [Paracoccaceae bacterium]MBT5914044.1 ABC transporter permease [Rhodospirillaceae bacterium]MDG2373634.1 ABC transporter permease [Paracoccaceae bacterium]|tara:strand:+ start:162 stop:1133 length:972 start_codon:yes stop_codon:yes gene_type:complete
MKQALIQRVILGVILIIAVMVLNFFLLQAAPGDVVDAMLAEAGGGDPELAARLRKQYGLDQPLYIQLIKYLGQVCRGDLGYSFYYDQSVAALLIGHLPTTLMLTLSALVLAVIIGTLFGVYAALKPNGIFSNFVTVLSLFGYATPVFWLGMIILLVFALYLPLFPAFGIRSWPQPENTFDRILDMIHHLVLPTFTLAILYLASYSRISRASMLDVLGSDYIRTARTKGLSEFRVIFKHALKNAAMPVVTLAGLQLAQVFSGAVLVETVFSLPGVGPLLYESIVRRDFPVILGVLFGAATTTIVANIITDIIYSWMDPRIKSIS